MNEPTILDYLKAKLFFWRGQTITFPEQPQEVGQFDDSEVAGETPRIAAETGPMEQTIQAIDQTTVAATKVDTGERAIPWRSIAALGLALIAQSTFEPRPDRSWFPGALIYLIAAVLLFLSYRSGEWEAAPLPKINLQIDPMAVHSTLLLIGSSFAVLAFITFGGNLFTKLNVLLWFAALVLIVRALWSSVPRSTSFLERVREFLARRIWNVSLSRWTLLVILVSAIAIFFRMYRLQQVPPEMVSDHAEKLLDIWDVLHGQPHIFFPRNTGREGFQMYLTATIILTLRTGYSFLSLKIGTVLGGLLTLPYLYLLGKEVGNRRIGLLAVAFAGIAYWPNLISRIALRFTLYPLFFAPTLYYFLRGIRTSNRNYFILSGLFLGIGLHGYSPFRFVPIVIVIGVGLYLLHRQSRGARKQAVFDLLVLAFVSLIVFLPLLRYALANPEMFSYRAITRLGTVEQPYPGPPLLIFLQNLWNALTMFAWDNGEVWVISITHRPVLDLISAALFHLGVVLLVVRYIRQRHWLDLFLLVSIPVLMMPSILSLAFPNENPSLNRTAAALVPVFLIIGIALDGLMTAFETKLASRSGKAAAWSVVVVLFALASLQNYDMVFNQYEQVYKLSSWNTSEIGHVIRSFVDSVGDVDSVYVVAYPYWVDTRIIGFSAGFPTKDFALWPENFAVTLENHREKLFVIKPEDTTSVAALQEMYPQGHLQLYKSKVETKDFWLFLVPADE